jgi:hypothetical protein
MVDYKITKILHAKLNLYKYIKVCTKVYYINTLIPFCFKLNNYISFTKQSPKLMIFLDV